MSFNAPSPDGGPYLISHATVVSINGRNGLPVLDASPKPFAQVAGSPFTLTASWQKVCTTTAATLGLRLDTPPPPVTSTYDCEWRSVPAGATTPTDAFGSAILAGETFPEGAPVGDIWCKSATGQKLIVMVA